MSRNNHPIEHEELMAYLDGELATERAVEAAAHLERCEVCRELAAELRKMSQEMMAWEVEQSEGGDEMPAEIVEALEKKQQEPGRAQRRRARGILITPRMLGWAGGFSLVLVFGITGILFRRFEARPRSSISTFVQTAKPIGPEYGRNSGTVAGVQATDKSYTSSASTVYTYDSNSLRTSQENGFVIPPSIMSDGKAKSESAETKQQNTSEGEDTEERPGVPPVPMIARTAGLTLVAKEFEKTRAGLEEILKRHNGYIGELSVSAPSDAGRTLTATLRIPAPQLEAAMAELKQLGRVENESQGGEEVTQQYVDLAARLANAQHTEKRLTEILSSRTGKLQDVLKVELEIDRVRGEIEQMMAEKKELTKRVAFATLNAVVKEEYHARLEATPPSTGSRFRNAAVDGYNSVVEGFISIGLFLLSSGPSLLIWAAILFFPARWLWRKVRAELKKRQEQGA
jgi:hypothetical protein